MAAATMLDALRTLVARGLPDEALVVDAVWYVDALGITHTTPIHAVEPCKGVKGILIDWVTSPHCSESACNVVRSVSGNTGGNLGTYAQSVISALDAAETAAALVRTSPSAALRSLVTARQALAKVEKPEDSIAQDADLMRNWALVHLPDLDLMEREATDLLTSEANRSIVELACARALASGPQGPVGELALLVTGDRSGKRVSTQAEPDDVLPGQSFSPDRVPQVLAAIERVRPTRLSQVADLEIEGALEGRTLAAVLDQVTDAWRKAIRARCATLADDIDTYAKELLSDRTSHLVVVPRTSSVLSRDVAAAFPLPRTLLPTCGLAGTTQAVMVPAAVARWMVQESSGQCVAADSTDAMRIVTALALLCDGGVYTELEAAWHAAGALT